MKRTLLFALLFCACAGARAQQNLFNYIYWSAYGNYEDENFSGDGLSYTNELNDSIRNSVTIAEFDTIYDNDNSGLAHNTFKLDTAAHAYFPGTCVAYGYLNDDRYKDLIVWSASGDVNVFLGTPNIDSFTLAFTLHFGLKDNLNGNDVLISDWDSSGSQGFIINDFKNRKIYFYHGGANLDSIPDDSISATVQEIAVGHVRDSIALYLVTYWTYSSNFDTVTAVLYPLGKESHLVAEDSLVLNTSEGGPAAASGGFLLMDVWNRGVQDILIGCELGVLVYKGGDTIAQAPSFKFSEPFDVGNNSFGTNIVNCGNFTGRGYPTILITEPEYPASGQDGWVFLFNCGAALRDSCTAFGMDQSLDQFGVTAICAGDMLNNGRTEIMVGSFASYQFDTIYVIGTGTLTVFYGDTAFGPSVTSIPPTPGQAPVEFDLAQNYPNPFSDATQITFNVVEPNLYGKAITLEAYSMNGRRVATLYKGVADDARHTVSVAGSSFIPGGYFYELQCDNWHLRKKMTIVR